ncbi:MarR family transcriptional regulator [Kitasatospora sp. NPDC048365]|uniref:MarR family transcriptional regulator n=1 Tax=Kitasatospora sp. NPDC048365 TaxID=3364050 RepID=UPI00371F1FD2
MRPIGYWLNRTDRALTARMDAMLAEDGLTRLGWQVLNAVHDDPRAGDAAVAGLLVANATPAALAAAVEALLADGRLTRPAPGALAPTAAGRDCLTEVGARVRAFRRLAAEGVPDEDYRTAIAVLERITRNVEAMGEGADRR